MIYIFLVLFFLICLLCRSKLKEYKHSEQWFVFVFFGVCALVMGLRGISVGQDTHNYYQVYNFVKKYQVDQLLEAAELTGVEFGYVLLMKITDMIFGEYLFFQLIISFTICFGYGKFLLNEGIDLGIGGLIFLGNDLFFASFNTTRQMLSVIILLFAWEQLNRKKYIKSILLLLCAFLIHSTAILFILLFGVYIFRKKKYLYWLAPLAMIGVAINYKFILYVLGNIFEKYSYILSNERTYMSLGLSAVVWIVVIIVSCMVLYSPKAYTREERINALLCFVYPILSALGLFMNYFERLAFYFVPFSAPVFESVRKKSLKKYRKLYIFALYVCFLVWFLISSTAYPYVLYSHP